MRRKKIKPIKVKKSFITKFKNLAIVCFLCYGIFILVSQQMTMSAKKEENEKLKNKVEVASQKNDELQYLSSISGTDEYKTRVAIEMLGYAYPDEIRIYDTSKN